MKKETTYIVVDNVAEEEAKKFWKQIDNLQERIDKALIYIKENTQNDTQVDMFDYDKFDELVKILKGDK